MFVHSVALIYNWEFTKWFDHLSSYLRVYNTHIQKSTLKKMSENKIQEVSEMF